MSTWLVLSNETLGDTLLSLRFLSRAKYILGIERLCVLVPPHFAGIAALIGPDWVQECVNPEDIPKMRFTELISLGYGIDLKKAVAPFEFKIARGFDFSGICGGSEIIDCVCLDGSHRTDIWRVSLEEAAERIDRLGKVESIYEEAWLSDMVLFPELTDMSLSHFVDNDRRIRQRVSRQRQGNHGARVLLLPGGVLAEKRRDERTWAAIAAKCLDYNMKCTIALGPHEVRIGFGETLSEVCEISYPSTIHRLGELTGNHDFAIAHDCGQMHVACQAGIPTIALFSVTNPNIWFPYDRAYHLCLGGAAPGRAPDVPTIPAIEESIKCMVHRHVRLC